MPETFIQKLTAIIGEHIQEERFGVSELAARMGMSRSNLLRRVKKETGLSASRFIRQVRLARAMELLREGSLNVSEVSYRVGFSSTSYFSRCFGEEYGYPPGEVGKRDTGSSLQEEGIPGENPPAEALPGESTKRAFSRNLIIFGAAFLLLILASVLFLVFRPGPGRSDLERSIAVLPFKNDSNDSTNVYFINGLMEAILDNLQSIEDLRVISRTSVEKYRDHPETIPELAKELNVNYFVEGSGQKIGDRVKLSIQLIEAPGDRHLWSGQYQREIEDVFTLQTEVAKNIAREIEAVITPEEAEQIERIPTDNLVAYDYFLQGLEYFYQESREGLGKAIPLFEKAIEHDPGFARAYADLSLSYAFMDIYQEEKKYTERIAQYADQALLCDPELPQSLIAKAMSHMVLEEYGQALPFLEKALEYHPNSSLVLNILSDYYARYVPNTEKYLEYALKGISLDIAAYDSTEASYIYLHLGNAFMQSGFVDEAEKYVRISMEYDPDNLYSEVLLAYVLYARDGDLEKTRNLLEQCFRKNRSRYDIVRELALTSYYLRDYPPAYQYFKELYSTTKALGITAYEGDYIKMALTCAELGFQDESDQYLEKYRAFAEHDQSIYRDLSQAVYHAYIGDDDLAVQYLKGFSEQELYPYWYILFMEKEPLLDPLRDHPYFPVFLDSISSSFRQYHERIRASLESEGLI